MKRKIFLIGVLVLLLSVLSGCSAIMAASGKRESAVSALQKGDHRNMVMAKMGHQPLRVAKNGNKVIEIYEIEKGNEPSVGRAVAHATLDIFTLGIWELIGTPLEAVNGEKMYLIAEYQNDILENYQITGNAPAGL